MSFILPVRNEASHVGAAIASIQRAAENLSHAQIEIIVVDGESDDETRDVVASLSATDDRIRLLRNPKQSVPHAMNLGIRAASGDIVIRVDGHAEIEPDFIVNALDELELHPECACVGGPIQNVDIGPVSKAISRAMSSPFGVGNARFRTGGQDGYVDTLAFGAYRKADILAIGLFDETLIRNQDDELNYRLLQADRKIWFSNRIRSRYYVRSELGKLYRQYFQYGYWKVYVNRKHNTVTSLRQLAPPVLVAGIVLLGVLGIFWSPARTECALLVGAYLLAAFVFALLTRPFAPRQSWLVMAAFVTLHFGYGLGYWRGLLDFTALGRAPAKRSGELSR
ncbi:MAG: glycosyltransferase family 2 protein [Trueperaceae bacterium]|nr:glycosyltransferase family 2 protein [Trueperaceae bacterium]